MKLALVVPTYGPVDPAAAKHLRVAVMHAAQHAEVQWVGDASPDRVGFAAARNMGAQAALATDADAVMWVDSDIILPADGISRLVHAGRDFITGIYCQRAKPHWPLIAHFDDRRRVFNWWTHWPPNVIAPIDGCGFGCVLTSRTLLQAIPQPWFTFEEFSEDFDFCLKAAHAGHQLYVDTGVVCEHLADPQGVRLADFEGIRDGEGLDRYAQQSSAA